MTALNCAKPIIRLSVCLCLSLSIACLLARLFSPSPQPSLSSVFRVVVAWIFFGFTERHSMRLIVSELFDASVICFHEKLYLVYLFFKMFVSVNWFNSLAAAPSPLPVVHVSFLNCVWHDYDSFWH